MNFSNNMIDIFFEGFLVFTRIYVITPIIIMGYFSKKSAFFEKALYILLFTLLLSPYLKSLWQIPLNPALNKEGFAFPSGHMQMATVFWGLLAIEFRQKWGYLLCSLLLLGIGAALIHFGYHTLIDVLGGLLFAILTLILFIVVDRKVAQKKTFIMGVLCSILGTGLLFVLPNPTKTPFLALGALYGFSLGSFVNHLKLYHFKHRSDHVGYILRCMIAFLGIVVIYGIASLFPTSVPLYFNLKTFIQFFCVGGWIAFCVNFISNFSSNQFFSTRTVNEHKTNKVS